jgi:ABC-type glycerol-3-phosphate transport system substrate-binding protein
MENNPNVKSTFGMIPMIKGDYQTKVKAALGTADAPDIVDLEAGFVRQFVETPKLLADLTDLVPLAKPLNYYPSVIEAATYQGVT